MDVRKLRYFVAAAEEENFHRAAERVFVAQPALSRYVRQLEQELGVQLFERVRKRVRLSPAGVVFLKHARSILQGVDNALQEMKQVASGREGVLRLTYIPSALSHPVVPRSVDRFRATAPGVELALHPATTRSALAALRAGEIDAAFVHRPQGGFGADIAAVGAARVDWVFAMPADHPLARRDTSPRLADFRGENFLWIPRDQSPELFDLLVPLCTAAGLTPKIVETGGDVLTYVRLVAAHLGVTITAATIAEEYQGRSIVFRRLAELPPPFHIDLVCMKGNPSSSLQRFLATFGTVAESG